MELEADFVFQQDREGVIACCYDVAAAIAAPGSTASRMDGDPSRERKTTRQNSLGGRRPSSFGMHHLFLPHPYDYARGASAPNRRSSRPLPAASSPPSACGACVHAGVLRWFAGLDELRQDAEPDPPRRELRQTGHCRRYTFRGSRRHCASYARLVVPLLGPTQNEADIRAAEPQRVR